jgi:DNA-binding NarL/FixJ family response regulator
VATQTVSPRALTWPLTGRRRELDDILESLSAESVKAVVLTGEPGVGKSRLARETLDRLADEGWSTLWTTATAATRDTPLGAIAHLVPRGVLGDAAAVVAHVRSELERRRRFVVCVDDAQLLDQTTVSLLGPLLDLAPVRIVVTVPELADAPEPVATLWRQGRAHVVELGRLDDLAVDTLVHRVLGGPVAGGTTLALLDASDGNPLFLRELVLGSLTAGTLHEEGGVWRIDGIPQASGVLQSLVRARVESLGATVHALLEDVAVAPAAALADMFADHGDQPVEQAERAGLLRVVESGRRRTVRVAHGLHREVLRAGLGRVAAARLARRHAERLEAHGLRRADDSYRVALLRLDADGQAPPEVLDAAVQLARAGHDLDSIERLTRAGLVASGSPTAARLLAEVLYERGRFDEADRVLADALAALGDADSADSGDSGDSGDSAAPGDPDTVATMRAVRAAVLAYGLGRFDDALDLLAGTPRDGLSATAATVVRLRRAQFTLWHRGPAAARNVLAETGPYDPAARQHAGAGAGAEVSVLALTGRAGEAVRLWDEPLPESPGGREVAVVLALTEAGDLSAAEELAQRCYALAARARLPLAQLWFAGGLARTSLLRGRPRLAMQWYREQLGLSRQLGQRLPQALAASGLMTAAALVADRPTMAEAAAAWDDLRADVSDPAMFPGDLARGPAWRLMADGDLEGAHAVLEAATARALGAGHVAQAAHAAYDRVRLGRPRAVAEDLAELAAQDDGRLLPVLAAHATAAAAGDIAALAEAADACRGLGLVLSAAEAASEAADLARRGGDPRRATALARQVTGWVAEVEGARTPALLAADAGQVERLTAREREIAVLVAQGRSSKDIAAALVLSVRTVDNHLQRIFGKLGVSSRAEVAAALGEEPA